VRGRALAAALGVALAAAPGCEELPAVPNVPPTASFVFSPVSPINAGGTQVTFNASGSRDSDGRVAAYTWNFGDGTAEETREGPVIAHVFPDTGARCVEIVYTVLLTVRDEGGDHGSASQTARVTELPAPGSNECR
jgi:trimeric autotransporter adhesin